ncbi:hypothetical protein AX16_010101 [Volvariella volvacea WC 439]|nr:hypothetical protein AX16_010101 [Volvariella volvacea WC 439]
MVGPLSLPMHVVLFRNTWMAWVHISLNELFPDAEHFVLLVILNQNLPLSKASEHFASTLQSRIKIETVLNHTAIVKYLSTPGITGVIVGDAGIAERDEMRRICKHLADGYLGDFFRILGSGWKSGPKYSTTMVLNPQHAIAQESPSLDESIIMTGAHVISISSTDVLYMPTPNSSTAPPENGSDTTHAPIVGRRVGRGYVGYIGDLDFGGNNSNSCSNLDSASIKVIFAMLGLLDTTGTTPSINSVPVPNAHATVEAETKPEPAAEVVNMTPL